MPTADYAAFFLMPPSLAVAVELAEDVKAKEETAQWDLKPCPFCGAAAKVHRHELQKGVLILCSASGCREVTGANMLEAAKLWDEPRRS